MDKNTKKSTETLDHWKLPSTRDFFQARGTYRNEEYPIVQQLAEQSDTFRDEYIITS